MPSTSRHWAAKQEPRSSATLGFTPTGDEAMDAMLASLMLGYHDAELPPDAPPLTPEEIALYGDPAAGRRACQAKAKRLKSFIGNIKRTRVQRHFQRRVADPAPRAHVRVPVASRSREHRARTSRRSRATASATRSSDDGPEPPPVAAGLTHQERGRRPVIGR
jgi:hypothetical protein